MISELPNDIIDKIIKSINEFSKTDMKSSEANTKRKIIEPMLEYLGWDTSTSEVELEYKTRIGSGTKSIDYVFKLDNKPVMLAEAKPFDEELVQDDSNQAISYGKVEDIRWVVLTNGRELKLFDTKKDKKDCLVFDVDLRKLHDSPDKLFLITRESISTGKIEEFANQLVAEKKVVSILEEKQIEIANEIEKILILRIGTEFKNRAEEVSKKLAEKAVELFRTKIEKIIEQDSKEIPIKSRNELDSKSPGEVLLCPADIDGYKFLEKYNEWGFVRPKRHVPYFALYVGKPHSSVLYFGEIESISQPLKSLDDIPEIDKQDITKFEVNKKIVRLKSRTLIKFRDPLPLKNKKMAPRGLRYFPLKRLIEASFLDEI